MIPELLEPGLAAVDALEGYDCLCVLVGQDERPLESATGFVDWRLGGALSRVLQSGFFLGSPGEKLLVPTDGRVSAPRLFAVGLGPRAATTVLGLEHALAAAAAMVLKAGMKSVALSVSRVPQVDDHAVASLISRAFLPELSGHKVGIFADKSLRAQLTAR